MDVGKSIKLALIDKGWRQVQLAKRMGVRPPAVSQLVGQKSCNGATLQKLADAFGLPVSEFVRLGER